MFIYMYTGVEASVDMHGYGIDLKAGLVDNWSILCEA